jgi:hypothetical protein
MDSRSYTGERSELAEKVLRPYGINVYGENLFRCVRSDCRFMISYDEWVPVYPNLDPQWVLEKWLSCDEFTGGMDRIAWAQQNYDVESNTMILGSFPAEGDYDFCFGFGVLVPLNEQTLQLVASVIETGKGLTMSQRKAALKGREAKKEAALRQLISDIVDEAQDSGTRDAGFTGYGGKSNAKRADDMPVNMTHEQLQQHTPSLGGRRGGKQLAS